MKWKELKGVEATYGKLLRLCCENDIQSIAESICNMLRSRRYGETYVGHSNTIFVSTTVIGSSGAARVVSPFILCSV